MQGTGKKGERDHYTAHSVKNLTKLAFWVVETQAGLPLLIAHPQLWRLQGFTSLESHSLEESREIDGCGGPDGDPWGSRLS